MSAAERPSATNHRTNLGDLPPELLDHIITYLPTASSLSNLGRTNKQLHRYVNTDQAWQTFSFKRFPSLYPLTTPSWRDTARTLTTLSRAYDRRAIIAHSVQPQREVLQLPSYQRTTQWRPPSGQTMGFIPQLDVAEEIGPTWADRKETLAYSTGAEVVLRYRESRGDRLNATAHWKTYRPLSAFEGRDDVTALHLVRRRSSYGEEIENGRQRLIIGTANGDLQRLRLPGKPDQGIDSNYFITQGRPVRSNDMLRSEEGGEKLLAVNLGDSHIVLYDPLSTLEKSAPLTELDLQPGSGPHMTGNGARPSTVKGHKIWSTSFLSSKYLAVGIGPNVEPIRIFSIMPSGLDKNVFRKLSVLPSQNELVEDRSNEAAPGGRTPRPSRSIYPIVPLPPHASAGSGNDAGNVFLSGGYDGIIRLHDLRSPYDVQTTYEDPTDESAIYSLLPRGRETVLAGAARNLRLKVFDLRLGAKCYDYREAADLETAGDEENSVDISTSHALRAEHTLSRTQDVSLSGDSASQAQSIHPSRDDYNLYIASHPSQYSYQTRRHRTAQSSVYALASTSHSSPTVYAGIENGVFEATFAGILDQHPDPVNFASSFYPTTKPSPATGARAHRAYEGARQKALKWMCNQHIAEWSINSHHYASGLHLFKQNGLRIGGDVKTGLDERWDG